MYEAPDLDLPNSIHAYQTAERIKKVHPINYEFQLSCFVVGDTYVLDSELPKSIVYYDTFPKAIK